MLKGTKKLNSRAYTINTAKVEFYSDLASQGSKTVPSLSPINILLGTFEKWEEK